MRHYYVYLIEEEFANHFFGREAKLFHLFQEYLRTSPEQLEFNHLYKQIRYVTKSISAESIDHMIESSLTNRYNYAHIEGHHRIDSESKRGNALLQVRDQYIEVTSIGSFDMEAIFFEILRKIDSCFLAMDFEAKRYGWLKPIKERKFV
ncbi:sporulation inhibitor of replication protein SirA [Metabacillus idriensis]|uniref:sporulation inhibitor of replication protein SirA n=1 Tax=Bacillaceae TaxID=186817 RepID=UPI00105A3306|nr:MULTISPECIES: sporulation inhibitor of replication protein SirA [Bacillaceae]MDR0137471.1 sporulation inhibitor of replication protein SirA [Metabacillus idriensis]TDL83205.1 sporulation inhibitor of replication protein SirA [Peribacillus frigoritolerans]